MSVWGKNVLKEGQVRKKVFLVMSAVYFRVYQSNENFCVILDTGMKVVLTQTVKICFNLCFGLAANIHPNIQRGECGSRSAGAGGTVVTWRHLSLYLHVANLKGSSSL